MVSTFNTAVTETAREILGKHRQKKKQHQLVHEKAKENWMGEQCSEIEENRRNNNSKRAYQLRISNPEHTRLQFDLEKLKDSNVLETFQAIMGGKFEVGSLHPSPSWTM